MQTPVHVTFRDLPVSDSIEAACWQEAEQLERAFDGIRHCHVTIIGSRSHCGIGKSFAVRIDLTAPGIASAVNGEPAAQYEGADIDSAVHGAFDVLRGRLQNNEDPSAPPAS